MKVETIAKDRVLIVRMVESRLDASLAMDLQAFVEKWTEDGYFRIILDLAHVDFIDSTTLGVIVQWFKRVRGKQGDGDGPIDGDLVICNIGFKVESLLELTRMDRVFTIYGDDLEAFHAMTGDCR